MPTENATHVNSGSLSPALGSCMLPDSNQFSSFSQCSNAGYLLVQQRSPTVEFAATYPTYSMQDIAFNAQPYLKIIEEPIDKIRYRYDSEKGSHGGLTGMLSTKSKKTYPTVQLENYFGNDSIIIKASLFTDEDNPVAHVHKLSNRGSKNNECTVKLGEDRIAKFSNLSIQYTKKEERENILLERKLRQKGQQSLTVAEQEEVKNEGKRMKMNCVKLCFEAFREGYLEDPICQRIFSRAICNQKCTEAGDLKISRISRVSGSCRGDEEVFLLIEKVKKEDIKIRFYERDDSGATTWEQEGIFSKADVHHQVAIVFRTPPYKSFDIDGNVEVFMDLYRVTDGASSESRRFTYLPDESDSWRISRKRKKMKDVQYLTPSIAVATQNEMLKTQNEDSGIGSNSGLSENLDEEDFNAVLGKQIQPYLLENTCPQLSDFISTFDPDFILSDNNDLEIDAVPSINGQMASLCLSSNKPSNEHVNHHTSAKACDMMEVPKDMTNTSFKQSFQRLMNKLRVGATEDLINGEISHIFFHIPELVSMQDNDGDNMLHITVLHQSGNTSLVEHLVNAIRGKSNVINQPNKLRQTPVHLATVLQQSHILRLFLENGGDPNIEDYMGNTCMHIAAKNDSSDCLKTMMHSKILLNINSLNNEGFSPLHVAVLSKTINCVELLLQAGSDINQKATKSGRTPLHMAAELHCPSVLSVLLKQPKLEVNTQDFAGNTALHLACASKSITAVQELMKAKAIPELKNFQVHSLDESENTTVGQTAADFAEGSVDILKILAGDYQCREQSCPGVDTENACNSNSKSIGNAADSGYISGCVKLMDFESEKKICALLDPPNDGWMKLGTYLAFDERELKCMLKLDNSPTRSLLTHFQKNGGETTNLIEILRLAELVEAERIIQSGLGQS